MAVQGLSILCQRKLTLPGALSQFTGPSNGVCPGDDVTFTCVVDTTTFTIWRVSSGGQLVTDCTYNRDSPDTNARPCGSDMRFTLSPTVDPNNSSLSVESESVDSNLNGINVTCSDGNGLIGSRDICVIGKIRFSIIIRSSRHTRISYLSLLGYQLKHCGDYDLPLIKSSLQMCCSLLSSSQPVSVD